MNTIEIQITPSPAKILLTDTTNLSMVMDRPLRFDCEPRASLNAEGTESAAWGASPERGVAGHCLLDNSVLLVSYGVRFMCPNRLDTHDPPPEGRVTVPVLSAPAETTRVFDREREERSRRKSGARIPASAKRRRHLEDTT